MKLSFVLFTIASLLTVAQSRADTSHIGCVTAYDDSYTKLINNCAKSVQVCWSDDNGMGLEHVGARNDTRVAKWQGTVSWNWIYVDDYNHGKRCNP